MRRSIIAGGGLVLLVAAGAFAAGTGMLTGLAPRGASAGASPTQAPVDLTTAAIERRTMRTTADLGGSLGYEGARAVAAGSAGTVTRLPDEGSVIQRGGVLYEVDGRRTPDPLLRCPPGVANAWGTRTLTDGPDIKQLEQNLKALGYTRKGDQDRHGTWDADTTRAVKRWQKATGQTVDGIVELGEVVFLPGAIRVTGSGGRWRPGVGPRLRRPERQRPRRACQDGPSTWRRTGPTS